MKRFTLILGAAALTAISATIPARAQTGCSWWDLSCNGLASRVSDYGWHIAGRDANGNVVYVRRRVDSSGNLIFEEARRGNYGLYQLFNTHMIRNGLVYNASGERCKYDQNEHGYKEECKYAKGSNFSGIRYPSSRFAAAGTKDCKYESNEHGYKEECKYPEYHAPKYEPPHYKPVKYEAPKPVKYEAPKYHPPKVIHYDNDVKGPKPHPVDYHAAKIHVEPAHVEKPHVEKPHVEKPHAEKPHDEKPHDEKPKDDKGKGKH